MLIFMRLSNDFTLDFTHFPKEAESIELLLGDDFFARNEGGEILGGDVSLILTVSPLDTNRFQLSFDYVGEVSVECDRCLQPLSIDIDAVELVDIVIGDSLNDVDDEVITLDAQNPIYDFSWIAYELLALHLPIQRMHEIEDCDPEMVKYLTPEEPRNEEEDPRWAELKRELSSKNNN
ncbi:hypothetical protein IX315_001933 [Porphyromonas levii]|nr:hypothetical protein [Porphyromonas levii]MBR8712700.1 hypothetical protein [Porphyromonas levii]MBR8714686.1 hypothetical protein [Porphyromonas levii]MBR8727170.1 hypothetical protein [Porphyromonas levii]MBR8731651.1 hypothetical protein [Porphyromonas levii]